MEPLPYQFSLYEKFPHNFNQFEPKKQKKDFQQTKQLATEIRELEI